MSPTSPTSTSAPIRDIAQRLSLRTPQLDALKVLASLVEGRSGDQAPLSLAHGVEPRDAAQGLGPALDLGALEAGVAGRVPGFSSFEREFPSLCFNLATGVGKTRLMGAFMAYLYRVHGVRHFFVLAPNLTIYDKLKADFSPGSSKYVLTGLSEFAIHPPKLIHGENYDSSQLTRYRADRVLFEEVHINVFNISKFNADATSTKKGAPRMKKLSETLGESYFDYLRSLPDLVLLMDESHRYRGDAGVKALNELRPLLGLELTATPHTEAGKKTEPFKNVVYRYGLFEAMRDGFVKEPAVATQKDFVAADHTAEEVEKTKLEDAIRLHEEVKARLRAYADRTGRPRVKPFILVIARDTTHAGELSAFLSGPQFFYGRYEGKVIEVHSGGGRSTEEKDEIVEKLLTVEDPTNPVEIVVHVNMLKEGWDVRNLYTIVPLRKADSKTLIEQSVGRGLRLPYGERTGEDRIDRLTIVAHDNFQALLDEANDKTSAVSSYFRPVLVEIDPHEPATMLVPSPTRLTALLRGEPDAVPATQATQATLAALPLAPTAAETAAVTTVRHMFAGDAPTRGGTELLQAASTGNVEAVTNSIRSYTAPAQAALPGFEAQVRTLAEKIVDTYAASTIEIPSVVITPSLDAESYFEDFDLDTTKLPTFAPVEKTILVKALREQEPADELAVRANIAEEIRLEAYIVRVLMDRDDVDYDRNAPLLQKLASQVVEHLRVEHRGVEEAVANVVRYYQRDWGDAVYAQLAPRFHHVPARLEVNVGSKYEVPKPDLLAVPEGTVPVDFRALVKDKSGLRQMMFKGFAKGVQRLVKLNSDSERRFIVMMEGDAEVAKWWCVRRAVLRIRYEGDHEYVPDFLVETHTGKWVCEVKREDQLVHPDVAAKKRAAVDWCKHASAYEAERGGKPWGYLLVPHSVIDQSKSFGGLVAEYGVRP